MRYAVVHPDGTIERCTADVLPTFDATRQAMVRTLVEVVPDINPKIEIVIGPTTVVDAVNVTDTYTKRVMTDNEIIGDRWDADLALRASLQTLYDYLSGIAGALNQVRQSPAATFAAIPIDTPAQMRAKIIANYRTLAGI